MTNLKIGIIGGTGWMGGGVAKQLLAHKTISPENLWLTNRTGKRTGFEQWSEVNIMTDNTQLTSTCDLIMLAVLPQQFLEIEMDFKNKLIISIMAGVSIDTIHQQTHSHRIVRCMPNAAAEIGLSYNPWAATREVNSHDKEIVKEVLSAFGKEDELADEKQINFFTALTGSGHGVLAYYAHAMINCALKHQINPDIAERAVRQLFLGVGTLIAKEKNPPATTVQRVIDYAGTTAEAVLGLRAAGIDQAIEEGIESAYLKAKSDMTGE